MAEPKKPNVTRHVLLLLGPCSGTVAIVVSWLIAIPRIRNLAEELGVEIPAFTQLLVNHAGLITTVGVIFATLGIIAIELASRHSVRIGISILTSVVLFVIAIWNIVVFWLLYVAMLEGVGKL